MQERLVAQTNTSDMAHEIWAMRKDGLSNHEIARELSVPTRLIKEIVESCKAEIMSEEASSVEQERLMAVQRAETIIRQYTPIMRAGTVQVQRSDSRGEPYTDDDWKYCLHAGHLVLKAIELTAKLHGVFEAQEAKQEAKADERILVFLRESMPTIRSIVEAQPEELSAGKVDLSFNMNEEPK